MAEAAGGISCALKVCGVTKDRVIKPGDGRVEVKTVLPPNVSASKLKVDWDSTGEAVFHYTCWSKIWKTLIKNDEVCKEECQMLQEARKTAEFHDPVERTKTEAKRVAQMIRQANYCICFTGAGISTAAGIGDFRGKAGKWTEMDRKKEFGAAAKPSRTRGKQYSDLRPTYTHEAIAKLVEMGHIKHVISQNCDGLHRLSGVPRNKLWELHGNVYHELCEKCGTRYERNIPPYALPRGHRDYKACRTCGHCHRTNSKCEQKGCDGHLMKTVINFGDNLESEVLGGAEDAARRNDLVLCLGSTLRVTPACDLVEYGDPIKLVICNRQTTPFDAVCSSSDGEGSASGARFFGDCDDLMQELMINLLGKDEEAEWTSQREDRILEYDKKRPEA